MEEDWGNTEYESTNVDQGTNFSRGRGFTRGFSDKPGADESTGGGDGEWGSSDDNWKSGQHTGRGGRGGRGGFRGGRGGRGNRGGGESRGFNGNDESNDNWGNGDSNSNFADSFAESNNDNDNWGGSSSSDNRGRGRGRGRGGRGRGRGGRNDFSNGGDGDNSGRDNGDDGWGRNDSDTFNGNNGDGDWNGGGGGDYNSDRRGRGGRGGGGGRGRGGRGGSSSFGDGNDGDGGDGGVEAKPREHYIPPEPTNDETEMFSTAITTGINFDNFDNIPVEVTGKDIIPPIKSFEESGLRQIMLDNINKSGYTRPTPIQKYAIPLIMGGRDVMACAQTGSGKTAAFLLPMINQLIANRTDAVCDGMHCEPQVVIVSPTRELTDQIFREARKFANDSMVKTVVVYGGTSIMHQLKYVTAGCHILVATPGRLIDFVNRGKISFASVQYVVLDEADRMLDMGFQPEIEKMMSHETMVPKEERQTLMFSATFPTEIQELAARYLNDYVFITIGIVGGACADVQQQVLKVDRYQKRQELLNLLQTSTKERTLVFVETKRNTDFIATYLSENKLGTTSIHGDRLQSERECALREFKAGKRDILVATDVAARGLDIKGVQHVINYDLPKSIDEYVHRIGRTGRLGNRGKATSFFEDGRDGQIAADLVRILRQANQEIPDWLESCSSGGGGTYESRSFGGRDARNDFSDPVSNEPEEEW